VQPSIRADKNAEAARAETKEQLQSMALFRASFLARSKQQWKLLIGSAMFVGGSTLMFMATSGSSSADDTRFAFFLLSGLALMIIATAWLALSIRCPQCGSKFFWLAVSKEHVGSWGSSLLTRADCPVCGHVPPHEM
jgi:hypothetical protein